MPPSRRPAALYLQLLMVSMIWGGTFIAGRQLAGSLPPLLTASLRFLLAAAVLLAFMAARRTPLARVSPRQALQLLALGGFGIFGYSVCFFYGLQHIGAARASLIVALNPAMIALACFLAFGERLSAARLAGIALCLLGAAAVIVSRDSHALQSGAGGWRGEALVLGCVACWVIYSVGSRGLSQSLGALQVVTYTVLIGALLLAVSAWALGQIQPETLLRIDAGQWLGLLYLGALGSALANIWYYDAIRQIGATRSGAFIALNPVTAVLCGHLLLGEKLSLPIAGGGLVIVLGILLSNLPGRDARPARG